MSAADEGRRIVDFYAGAASDDRGRFVADILRFDDEALERVHDYIQWLFPMRERSGANPAAPRLDGATIEAFANRPELRAALRRSLDRMLSFYNLQWDGAAIVRGPAFAERAAWLSPHNHNYLRFTRILTSLRALGEDAAARALFDCLTGIVADEKRSGRDRISEQTVSYWRETAETALEMERGSR